MVLPPLRLSPVHPHARGDNRNSRAGVPKSFGSPPRAWGQRIIPLTSILCLRFTPTRVGTTVIPDGILGPKTVHPHARGDNAYTSPFAPTYSGSPPRAWGQLPMSGVDPADWRFTPTRVGTTVEFISFTVNIPVHPHARGDNFLIFCLVACAYGSPPRAWGQLRYLTQNEEARRFTPTRVGTTLTCFKFHDYIPVHPHARGDNF